MTLVAAMVVLVGIVLYVWLLGVAVAAARTDRRARPVLVMVILLGLLGIVGLAENVDLVPSVLRPAPPAAVPSEERSATTAPAPLPTGRPTYDESLGALRRRLRESDR